eukprot:gene5073-6314_t
MGLFTDIFGKKSHYEFKTVLFYSFYISCATTSGLLFMTITSLRDFFTLLDPIFMMVFISQAVSSSRVIVDGTVWASCFIHFVFCYISSSMMLGSKFLPYNFGKMMYVVFFLFTYFVRPDNKSPIPLLKFFLVPIISFGFVLFWSLIFRPYFSSSLFLNTSVELIKYSRFLFKLLERELEVKTLSYIFQLPPDNESDIKISSHLTTIRKLKARVALNTPELPSLHRKLLNAKIGDNNENLFGDSDDQHRIPPKPINSSTTINIKQENNGDNGLNELEEEMKSIIPVNKSIYDRTQNRYRKALDFLNVEFSKKLSKLDKYLDESKKEFWNQDLYIYTSQLYLCLEKNHKVLRSMKLATISDEKSKYMLRIIPYLDILIQESSKIFSIMEKQLSLSYPNTITSTSSSSPIDNLSNQLRTSLNSIKKQKNFEIDLSSINHYIRTSTDRKSIFNPDRSEPDTLEYSQYTILKSFEKIDKVIKEIHLDQSYSFLPTADVSTTLPERDLFEICKIHFLLHLLIQFCTDQKILSSTIFLLVVRIYTNQSQSRLTRFTRGLSKQIDGLLDYLSKWWHIKRGKEQPLDISMTTIPPLELSMKEKISLLWKNFKKTRLVTNWQFALKFSLGVSALSVGYYEVYSHSSFIIFRNSGWAVVTFTFVNAPTIGAIGFLSLLRFLATIIGSFTAYATAVLYTLPNGDPGKSFILIGITFILILVVSILTNNQSFSRFLPFFVLTFALISFIPYQSGDPSIITSLLRMMHISFGILFVLIFSIVIFPYYDHRKLFTNLYQMPLQISDTLQFIVNFSFFEFPQLQQQQQQQQPASSVHCFTENDIPNRTSHIEFKKQCDLKFNQLRSKIPIQRELLLHSRFELPFNHSKFKGYEEIVKLISKLYASLLSFGLITLDKSTE